MQATDNGEPNPLSAALARLQDIVLDGLQHGFFECSVSGEVIQGKKLRLLIRAGKNYRYVISEDDLPRPRQKP